MNDSSALQELMDVEAIKKLKARYFRLMDTKQWDEMYSLFVDDLETEGMSDALDRESTESGIPDVLKGAKAFIDQLVSQGPEVRTVHHGHMPEIEIITADSARGVWALADYVEWPQEWTSVRGVQERQYGLMAYGHYEEEYRKEDGIWKISRMRLTRLRVDQLYSRVQVEVLRDQA